MIDKEIVEIVQHKMNGGEVERRLGASSGWEDPERAAWDFLNYRYRKKEKPSPTHKEIMTKWWKKIAYWYQVEIYYEPDKMYRLEGEWCCKEYFNNLEGADIPLE